MAPTPPTTTQRLRDESMLIERWQSYAMRSTLEQVHDSAEDDHDREAASVALARMPEVTALEALEANRRLVTLLTGRRWYVMRDAREAGASWSEVATAVGMSRQGAYDWYRRKIREQEDHVPEYHDADRARAAL